MTCNCEGLERIWMTALDVQLTGVSKYLGAGTKEPQKHQESTVREEIRTGKLHKACPERYSYKILSG